MRPDHRLWTPWEDRQILAAWANDGDMRHISREINRTYQACITRISQLRREDPSIPYRNPEARAR